MRITLLWVSFPIHLLPSQLSITPVTPLPLRTLTQNMASDQAHPHPPHNVTSRTALLAQAHLQNPHSCQVCTVVKNQHNRKLGLGNLSGSIHNHGGRCTVVSTSRLSGTISALGLWKFWRFEYFCPKYLSVNYTNSSKHIWWAFGVSTLGCI